MAGKGGGRFHEIRYALRLLWSSSFACLSGVFSSMRYLVKARVKAGREKELLKAIEDGSLGRGSIAGDEYEHDMRQARMNEQGVVTWVETCFCETPLQEEKPYWEAFFHLLEVKDAHSRRNCRHENGTESWACCDCDCTKALEAKLNETGVPFLDSLAKS